MKLCVWLLHAIVGHERMVSVVVVAELWWLKPEALGSFPAAPPVFLSLCCFKGLWTVTAQIVFNWMISIGLRTVGESRSSDSPCCDYAHHPFMIHVCNCSFPVLCVPYLAAVHTSNCCSLHVIVRYDMCSVHFLLCTNSVGPFCTTLFDSVSI